MLLTLFSNRVYFYTPLPFSSSIQTGKIERRLMRYDTTDEDFIKTNYVLDQLTEIVDAESPSSRRNSTANEGQLEGVHDDTSQPQKKISAELSFYDWLEKQGVKHETGMMGMVEAGYANTLCSNNHDISLKGVIQWKKQWEEEDGSEDSRFVHSYKVVVQYFLSKIGIAMPLYTDGRMPPTQVCIYLCECVFVFVDVHLS